MSFIREDFVSTRSSPLKHDACQNLKWRILFLNLCLNFLSPKHKLARHRWLVSFTYGGSSSTNEYKKLQALLRNDNIQVRHQPALRRPERPNPGVRPNVLPRRSAEWTAQQTRSCASRCTSWSNAWPSSKAWGSTTLRSTMVSSSQGLCSLFKFTLTDCFHFFIYTFSFASNPFALYCIVKILDNFKFAVFIQRVKCSVLCVSRFFLP